MRPSSRQDIPITANRGRTRTLVHHALKHGGFCAISGTSPRHLLWLDEYAQDHGLEIRDPGGYLTHHDDFLALVHGHAPGGRRAKLAWTVQIGEPAEPLAPGVGRAIAEYTDAEIAAGKARPEGRIHVYAAGAKADPSRFTVVEV